MAAVLTLNELLKTSLAHGAVGFTLRNGLQPIIYPANGPQTHGSQPSAAEDIDEILRQLMNSREMRQYRAIGVVHFRCVFDGISILGGAKIDGDAVRVELRRMASLSGQ